MCDAHIKLLEGAINHNICVFASGIGDGNAGVDKRTSPHNSSEIADRVFPMVAAGSYWLSYNAAFVQMADGSHRTTGDCSDI